MALMTNSDKKVRVSLDLPAAFNTRLEALEKLTQADSKAGLIRQALQIYEYIARKTLDGYSFRAVNPDGKEENLVFFSPYLADVVQAEEDELVTSR